MVPFDFPQGTPTHPQGPLELHDPYYSTLAVVLPDRGLNLSKAGSKVQKRREETTMDDGREGHDNGRTASTK